MTGLSSWNCYSC